MALDPGRWLASSPPIVRYGAAVASCGLATSMVLILPRALWLPSGALVYLIAVLGVSVLAGRAAAILASTVSFAAFDFFFVEPRFSLTISNPNEWVALLAFLVVALVTLQLAAAQRERLLDAEAREREARLLHDLTDLLVGGSFSTALNAVSERLRLELGAEAVTIAIAPDGGVSGRAEAGTADAHSALRAAPGPMNVLGEGHPASAGQSGSPGRWVWVLPAYRPPGREQPRNGATGASETGVAVLPGTAILPKGTFRCRPSRVNW